MTVLRLLGLKLQLLGLALQEVVEVVRLLRFRRRRDLSAVSATALCFGNSHMHALWKAWNFNLYRPAKDNVYFKFINKYRGGNLCWPVNKIVVNSRSGSGGGVPRSLEDALTAHWQSPLPAPTWIVSIAPGDIYNVLGLFGTDPAFDFVLPQAQELKVNPDACLLPYDAVKMMAVDAARDIERFYRCLPRHNAVGVIHVEGPPPNPSEEYCNNSLNNSLERDLWRKRLGLPKGIRVAPPELRLKLFKVQSEVNREFCRANDVIYVSPPEEALDADGYLLPQAWHGATHASAWYGALMLNKIESVIAGRQGRT